MARQISNALSAGYSADNILDEVSERFPKYYRRFQQARHLGYDATQILQQLVPQDSDDHEALTEHQRTQKIDAQNQRKATKQLLTGIGVVAGSSAWLLRNYLAEQAGAELLPALRMPKGPGKSPITLDITPKPRGGPPGLPAPRQMLQGPKGQQRLNAPPPARIRGKQPGPPQSPIPMAGPRSEDLMPDVPELRELQAKQSNIGQLWNMANKGKTEGNPFLKAARTLVRTGELAEPEAFGHFFDWWKATEGQQRGGPLVEYEKFRIQTKGMFEPPGEPQQRSRIQREAPQAQQEVQPDQQASPIQEEAPQPQMEAPAGIRERTQQAAFAEQPELKQMLDHTFKGKEFSRPTYKMPSESAEDFRVRHTIDAAIKKTAKAITEGKTFLDFFERAEDPDMPGREIYRKPQDLKSGALSTADDILKYLAGASGPYEMLLDDREKEELDNGLSGDTNIYGAQITPNMVWNLMMVIDPKLSTIKEIPAIKGGPKAKIPFNRTNAARYLTHAVYGVLSGKNISPELSEKIQRISNAVHGLDIIVQAEKDGNFRRILAELERLSDDDYFMELMSNVDEDILAQHGIKGMEPAKGSAADTKYANELKDRLKENVPIEKPVKPKIKKKTEEEILEEDLIKAYDKLRKLDDKMILENRSGKKINVDLRAENIKKYDALQKRVDDIRDELDRLSILKREKKKNGN